MSILETPSTSPTCLTRIPSNASLIRAEKGHELPHGRIIYKSGYFIQGRLGDKTIEAFKHPTQVLEDFVNLKPEPKEVLRFTRRYGILRERYLGRLYYDSDEQRGYETTEEFLLSCEDWLIHQAWFRKFWQQARNGGEELAKLLSEHLRLDKYYRSGPVVEVKVVPKSRGFVLQLEAGDLWQALCLMLVSFSSRLRHCQNDTCSNTPWFVAQRRDQKCCIGACSRSVANRRWWNEHGEKWRANRSKQK